MLVQKKSVTVVTFTCGHSAEFEHSTPQVGEMMICWSCAQLTTIEKVQEKSTTAKRV